MARGSVFKRCQCRDGQGRKLQGCKRSHGSWGFVVDSGEDPNTGRRKQVKRGGFQTKSDAQAAMTAALNDLHRGTWVDDHAISLGEWLDNWLAENSGRRSVKTMANYRGHVRDVWRPQLGHLKLRELRRAHIEAVLRGLAEEIAPESRGQGNVGRPVRRRSSTTIEGYRRTLRAALSAARRRGLISTNPAEGRIDAIEAPTAHTISIWEPEQTAAFLEHVRADRYAALYELAAYAGLRRAELCGLRWIDIDGDGRGLTVRQSIVELAGKDIDADLRRCPHCGTEHRGLLAKGPKSAAGVRWVPLVAPARAALEARRQEYLTQREACGAGYVDHGLVFCNLDGTPIRPGSVTTAFEHHVTQCGLPRIRLHDLRHGACSMLLAGGVPIELVQMILGHSSPTVTRRVYAHVMREATADQVEKASQLLDKYRRDQSVTNQLPWEEGRPPRDS